MSDDNASPSDYSPIDIVRSFHQLPHLNAQLQRENNDFDITYDEQYNSYTRSLLTLPIIIGAIALLSLLAYHIYLCSRSCCCSHYRLPPRLPELRKEQDHCLSTRCKVLLLFVVCLLGVVISDQAVLFGNESLTSAVSKLDDGLGYLKDTFTTLENDGNSLSNDGDKLRDQFDAAAASGCDGAQDLDQYIDDYDHFIGQYQDEVDIIPGKIADAEDYVHQWGVEYKNYSIWALYGMVLVTALVISIGILLKSDCVIYCSVALSNLVLVVLFIIVTAEMIILMGLSDFCMDPSANLVQVVQRSIAAEVQYYTTCKGTNPLLIDIQDAQSYIDDARSEVDALLEGSCSGNDALEASLDTFDQIDSSISSLEDTASCGPTLQEIESVVNNGLCNKAFTGIYTIWLGQYLSAAFLLLLLLVASFSFYRAPPLQSDIDQLMRGEMKLSGSNDDERDNDNDSIEDDNNGHRRTPSKVSDASGSYHAGNRGPVVVASARAEPIGPYYPVIPMPSAPPASAYDDEHDDHFP